MSNLVEEPAYIRHQSTIVLERFLHIGDRVKMQMDSESRGWGRKGPPDGTFGTVIGFHRWESWEGRVHNFGKKPGKYMRNGGAMIAWDNGVNENCSAHDLVFASRHELLIEERRKEKKYHDAFDFSAWIEELPELPIWEWDTIAPSIKLERRDSSLLRDYGPEFFVERIEYNQLGQTRNDGVTPMPIYQCRPVGRTGPSFSLDSTEVVLMKRGNVWKWFNDKSSLVFKDLAEEANLAKALGLYTDVRNPRNNLFSWSRVHFEDALKKGEIDGIAVSPGMFGARPMTGAYLFNDRDLGERVRAETMRGFGL